MEIMFLFLKGFKELDELFCLFGAGEAGDLNVADRRLRIAVALPGAEVFFQERADLRNRAGGAPGPRLAQRLFQHAFVVAHAEDGLADGQRLEQLGRHDAFRSVSARPVGEEQEDGAPVQNLRNGRRRGVGLPVHEGRNVPFFRLRPHQLPRGVVYVPIHAADLGSEEMFRLQLPQPGEKQRRVAHRQTQQSARIRNHKLFRPFAPRVKNRRIESIIY